MDKLHRKRLRLQGYDYSSSGAYFITVCVKNHVEILSELSPAQTNCTIPENSLLYHGKIADKYINHISSSFKKIKIENYIIMPNHIHFLLIIQDSTTLSQNLQHNLISDFVRLFKRYCNKEYGENIWQRSFNDHIIRNEKEYEKIWNYIEYNTLKWEQDKFNPVNYKKAHPCSGR